MSALASPIPAGIDLLAHRVDLALRAVEMDDMPRAREQLRALAAEADAMADAVPFRLALAED